MNQKILKEKLEIIADSLCDVIKNDINKLDLNKVVCKPGFDMNNSKHIYDLIVRETRITQLKDMICDIAEEFEN